MINQPSESSQPESRTKKIRFTFLRHSQKQSGAVFSKDGTTISPSQLSENGIQRAIQIGRDFLTGRKFNKTYHTNVERTKQTLNAGLQGAESYPNTPKVQNGHFTLPAINIDEEAIAKYTEILLKHKQEYLQQNYPGQNFSDLSPDQQEEVAEHAEEFAMQWFLNLDTQKPSNNSESPREQASKVAYKINRLINLFDHINPDKEIDLLSVGHKSSTESFLTYILQNTELENSEQFTNISQIGGTLKILDGWDLEIDSDSQGQKICTITIRRENGQTTKLQINPDKIAELALEHMQKNNIDPKKIDSPKDKT